MMYPVDGYIWILVIAFGVISSLMNKGKTKSKNTPSSMPTFGGSGERSLLPSDSEEDDYDVDPRTPQSNREFYPSPDYDTGEGVSQMWAETKDKGQTDVQQDIYREPTKVDNVAKTPTNEWDAYANSDEETRKSNQSGIAHQVVNGLIWSEVLGPPRAKRAFSKRKF
jgi:hypothetical protein